MSDEASPRPWRTEPMGRVGMDCLIDAEGQYIATVGKTNSALIVNAVNFYKEITKRNLLNAEKVCELFDKIELLEDENKRMREAVKHESAELEDLVDAVKELRDGMCQHCDMRDLCAEGEDGMSTTCNAMAKVKNFIERHEKHETNGEAPF